VSSSWLWHSLLVGTGGFVGSILRFGAGGLVYRLFPAASLPYGTLTVNVVGCFLIGLLGGLGDSRQFATTELRLFLFLGLLGGFTTFSAFGYETLTLFRDAEHFRAGANVGLHLVLGLASVSAGYALGKG